MATISIPPFQVYRDPVVVAAGESLTVNGPGIFSPTSFSDDGTAVVTADVIGNNVWNVDGDLTLYSPFIGVQLNFESNGNAFVTIEHPRDFFGVVGGLTTIYPQVAPSAFDVELIGIAGADAYTLKHDLLMLTGANGHVLDTIRLAKGVTNNAPSVFEEQGNVYLTWDYGAYKVPGFGTAGFAPLPEQHI